MKKDVIYLGNNPVNERDLCGLIVCHLAKNDDEARKTIVELHMKEIRDVSKSLIKALGGSYVEARTFNTYFHEIVHELGYTTSSLCAPYVNPGIREGYRR